MSLLRSLSKNGLACERTVLWAWNCSPSCTTKVMSQEISWLRSNWFMLKVWVNWILSREFILLRGQRWALLDEKLSDTGEKYNIHFIACNSELNQAVRRDVYQLSTREEMLGSLKEGSVFFKLDLYANSGFHQIVLLRYMYLSLLPRGHDGYTLWPLRVRASSLQHVIGSRIFPEEDGRRTVLIRRGQLPHWRFPSGTWSVI